MALPQRVLAAGVLLFGIGGIALATLPAGLDGRANFGAYLDGNLPLAGAGGMPATLSATGAFANLSTLTPHPGLIPYDINSPLWSDAAVKIRYVALPYDGTSNSPKIGFASTGKWTFPAGTVWVKQFNLVTNEQLGTTRRLETRILVRDNNGGVYGASYRWRPDNSDADIVVNPTNEDGIVVTHADGTTTHTQSWLYPGQAQCLECHNNANPTDPNGTGMILGLKTVQMNKNFTYVTGRTDNQLNTWSELGMFDTTLSAGAIAGFDKHVPLTDTTATLEKRVRSYVDSNCAYCHQPNGAGPIWDARSTTPILNQNIAGDATNPGAVLRRFSTEYSRIYIRDSVDPRVTSFPLPMPPIARNIPDPSWLSTLSQWINHPFDTNEAWSVGDNTKVRVKFSHALDTISALQVGNYSISNGVTVIGAELDAVEANTVVLTTSALQVGVNYRLRLNNVREAAAPNNAVWPNTYEDFSYLTALAPQSINFAPLADRYTRNGPLTLTATGGASGNPVVFSSLTPSICSSGGTNGALITPTGASGLCTITANQAGNNTTAPAPQVTQSFKMLLQYDIVLEGSQETPPNVSLASGSGSAIYDGTNRSLKLNLTYSALPTPETDAHVHGPAARGQSAGPIASLASGSPKTDTVTLTPAQETQLLAGQLYVNVHSSAYPGGELRGQIDNMGSAGVTLQILFAGLPFGSVQAVSPVGSGVACVANCTVVLPKNLDLQLSGYDYGDGDPAVNSRMSGCDSTTFPVGLPGEICGVKMTTSRTLYAVREYLGTPYPPTITSIVQGNGEAIINFTPPPYNGGFSVIDYTVSCAMDAVSVSVTSTGTAPIIIPLSNGATYTCSMRSRNSFIFSAPSNSVTVTPNPPLTVLTLKSRKSHNGVDYDLPMAYGTQVAGTYAIEPRAIGTKGHQLRFEFNQAISSITSVNAKDVGTTTSRTATFVREGNVVVVTLPDLPDNNRITIELQGVNGVSNFSTTVGFLVGDVNDTGRVTAADLMGLKSRGTQVVDASNFRFDLNLNGTLTSSDISQIKSRMGVMLP